MKTIKLIDLLNKIANGEEVPEKIKHYQDYYTWFNGYSANIGYCKEPLQADGNSFLEVNTLDLNKEVKIVGEDKKDNFTGWKMYQDGKEVCSMDCSPEEDKKIEYIGKTYDLTRFASEHKEVAFLLRDMTNKINELIDKVNKFKHDTK